MFQYIIQIILFQLAFLLVYELWLKTETFFNYNRSYLLITPVLAILLPFLKLQFLENSIPTQTLVLLPEVIIGGGKNAVSFITAADVTLGKNSEDWWLITYVLGLVISVVLFLIRFRKLLELFRFKVVSKSENLKIVEVPDSNIACTFYDTIFLGNKLGDKEREQILSHEMIHVRQRHTLDLLFFEFLKIIFWFNPLIYIYQSRISALHEFIADAGVVEKVEKRVYFQQLLNSTFNTQNISFINQFFNHSIIKKRIVMLQKSRSKTIAKFKYLILVPLMLVMLTYVSCSEDSTVSPKEQEVTAREKLEEIKAIIDDGTEFTAEDKERVAEILGTIGKKDVDKVVNGTESVSAQKINKTTSNSGDIPFAVIEEVPIFPGCESLDSNEERKNCMTEKITEFISQNFNDSLGKELGLKGVNRVYVQFKISKDGIVKVLGARAAHPTLKEEAVRVVNLFPNLTPGKQGGQEVGVLYSLPITFVVE